jgi:hypothetical protein
MVLFYVSENRHSLFVLVGAHVQGYSYPMIYHGPNALSWLFFLHSKMVDCHNREHFLRPLIIGKET